MRTAELGSVKFVLLFAFVSSRLSLCRYATVHKSLASFPVSIIDKTLYLEAIGYDSSFMKEEIGNSRIRGWITRKKIKRMVDSFQHYSGEYSGPPFQHWFLVAGDSGDESNSDLTYANTEESRTQERTFEVGVNYMVQGFAPSRGTSPSIASFIGRSQKRLAHYSPAAVLPEELERKDYAALFFTPHDRLMITLSGTTNAKDMVPGLKNLSEEDHGIISRSTETQLELIFPPPKGYESRNPSGWGREFKFRVNCKFLLEQFLETALTFS
ncbi:hypothetical protein BDP27DRAFT_1374618 [Rhodocollybia butyracea]|uniref:Uncharacterized protein n=1 Tax=Rhodocollybia butyracea TaxID=206335 RepID=A0A9P5P7R2_9AGAR|nr:hypothetical protein BDP27DRAFT_1374618 [Rhodocollybia butyracea]